MLSAGRPFTTPPPPAALMESDLCPFNRLPGSMCAAFLQQAFRQLDQRHLYGIAPLVCHAWHQAAISSSDMLDLQIASPAKAEQLQPWMQRYGTPLRSISLTCNADPLLDLGSFLSAQMSSIYTSSYEQLRDLRLQGPWEVKEQISALTSLTSLSLPGCYIDETAVMLVLALTQLRVLNIAATRLKVHNGLLFKPREDIGFLSDLSTSLVRLTQLNVTAALWTTYANFGALRALPHLRELEAGKLPISSARLLREFEGLPLLSMRVAVKNQGDVGALKVWLQQGGQGWFPLSCLRAGA